MLFSGLQIRIKSGNFFSIDSSYQEFNQFFDNVFTLLWDDKKDQSNLRILLNIHNIHSCKGE